MANNSIVFPSVTLGNTIWFSNFLKAKEPIIDIGEHYEKMTFRNRYEIGAANGRQLLSIPLLNGRGQRMPMKDVKISYAENWQDKHFKSWESAYRRTPFYEYYLPYFESLFTEKFDKLIDFNDSSLKICLKILKIDKNWQYSETFINNSYLNYKSKESLKNAEDTSSQRYIQPFDYKNGFLDNLSIIDMLFCEGPNTIQLLK